MSETSPLEARRVAISVPRAHKDELIALLRNEALLSRYSLSGLRIEEEDVVLDEVEPTLADDFATWLASVVDRVKVMWRNRKGAPMPVPAMMSLELDVPSDRSFEYFNAVAPLLDPEKQQDCISWMCSRARVKTRDVERVIGLRIEPCEDREIESEELDAALESAYVAYQSCRDESADWPRRRKKQYRELMRDGLQQSCVGARLVAASVQPGEWSDTMYLVGMAALREGTRTLEQSPEAIAHAVSSPSLVAISAEDVHTSPSDSSRSI
jgi:hypothetical protein